MSRLSRAYEKARRERTHREDPLPRTQETPVPTEAKDPSDESKVTHLHDRQDRPWGVAGESLSIPEGAFGPPDAHLVSLVAPSSVASEQFRMIRYLIEQMKQERSVSVVAVTSANPKEGKTVTTINLAGSLAQDHNQRILLVDGDLRQPAIASYLRMESEGPGLPEAVLNPTMSLEKALRLHPDYHFALLPSRPTTLSPYEVFNSPRMVAILQEVREHFDYILIDLPPLIFPDCHLLEKLVDGFLIVVGANQSTQKMLDQGIESLGSDRILGLLLNRDTQPRPSYYSYCQKPQGDGTD